MQMGCRIRSDRYNVLYRCYLLIPPSSTQGTPFQYLALIWLTEKYTSTSIKFNTEKPIYEDFNKIEGNWGNLYAGESEYLTNSCPTHMGKTVLVSSFYNENFMDDLNTGKSQSCIIHLMNKNLIESYFKSQYCVENSTYCSEYNATRICTD